MVHADPTHGPANECFLVFFGKTSKLHRGSEKRAVDIRKTVSKRIFKPRKVHQAHLLPSLLHMTAFEANRIVFDLESGRAMRA